MTKKKENDVSLTEADNGRELTTTEREYWFGKKGQSIQDRLNNIVTDKLFGSDIGGVDVEHEIRDIKLSVYCAIQEAIYLRNCRKRQAAQAEAAAANNETEHEQ